MKAVAKTISFVPSFLLNWLKDKQEPKTFPAIVAFADVSGFTAMSSQLASIGKEGAETLTSILNNYFTSMINRIQTGGGFVGKFGGDAMTIFFPAEDESDLSVTGLRAIHTCIELQGLMDDFNEVKTKAGTFSLGMKIGIAEGDVLFKVVGDDKLGKEFLLAGIPLDNAAEAEHHGKSGDVIVSPGAAQKCDIKGKKLDDGFVKVSSLSEKQLKQVETDAELKVEDESSSKLANLAKPFIDPAVYHRLQIGLDSVGEIRRASVIFMSFSGLDYAADPEVGHKLDTMFDWVNKLVFKYQGSINKVDMGDKGSKMIITFGAPTAHEDDARNAVHCGLELVKGNQQLRDWGIEQRLGLATGSVFAGEVGSPTRQEYTVMGTTVNLSARIMAYSKPGQLNIDQATHDLTSSRFEFSDPEPVQFKGISRPLPVYRVKGISTESASSLTQEDTALINRKDEIKRIDDFIQGVISGQSRCLIIHGDAGVGKSRLVREVIRNALSCGFKVGGGEAFSYAQESPYLIWTSVLRSFMGVQTGSTGEETIEHLNEIIHQTDPEHVYRLPILANLLGISCPENEITKHFDAKLRQENLFDFLLIYFRRLATQSPVAIVFEDAQWADISSWELTAYLKRNLQDAPLMFIVAERSGEKNPACPSATNLEESADTIDLKEFNQKETREFILGHLKAHEVNKELLKFVYDFSHGNPSFIEELLRNLKSLDKIKIVPGSKQDTLRVEKSADLTSIEVPDSLNGLIMSQLDRLDPSTGLTVKVAAVVGRHFARDLVNESYPVEATTETISNSLAELETLDLIQTASSEPEITEYIFKNMLTRDVAYDSLLFAHRREYHRRIGLCLETLKIDSVIEACEQLAHHFHHSEDSERAARYLKMAGDKSFELFANESADTYYSRGLEHAKAEANPEKQYNLLAMRAKTRAILGKRDLWKIDLDEQLEIARNNDNPKWELNTLDNLASYYLRLNDINSMKEVLDRSFEILKNLEYPFLEIATKLKMGQYCFVQNQYKEALDWWVKGSKEAEAIEDNRGLSVALTNCGVAYRSMGDLDKALEYYNKSITIDRETGNKRSEAVNLGNIGVIHHRRGEIDQAFDAYSNSLEIARGIGSKEIQARNLGNLAALYQFRGEREKALSLQKEKLVIEQMMNYKRGQVITLGNLGTWYADEGQYSEAVEYYLEALELARELGLKTEEPRLKLNIGQTLHYRGNYEGARTTLDQAIEAATASGQKFAEEFARRYLGFVLLDMAEFEKAGKEFQKARELAQALGDKGGVAAANIGLGVIELFRNDDRELIDQGIAEARKVSDAETTTIGLIRLARYLMKNAAAEKKPNVKENLYKQALELLEDGFGIAESSGRRCDLDIINPLVEEVKGKLGGDKPEG